MSKQLSLRQAERTAFRAAHDDGLWDILLGFLFFNFAFGAYLSPILGDFWASIAFLPFWALVYAAIVLTRRHIVAPRIGTAKFSAARRKKLAALTLAMLVVNVLAFVVGLAAAIGFGLISGRIFGIVLGMFLLVALSLAAFFLEFPRLYLYGLLLGLAPVVGEWLWTRGYAAHHGFPLTFGVSAGIMILVGMGLFLRLLRNNPIPPEGVY